MEIFCVANVCRAVVCMRAQWQMSCGKEFYSFYIAYEMYELKNNT